MTIGNLVAIQQKNLKRLVAYSSIGQVGYMLVVIAAIGYGDAEVGRQRFDHACSCTSSATSCRPSRSSPP